MERYLSTDFQNDIFTPAREVLTEFLNFFLNLLQLKVILNQPPDQNIPQAQHTDLPDSRPQVVCLTEFFVN